MSLQTRRVLVVRPQQQQSWGGDQFIGQLTAAGAQVLHYPVMTLEPFLPEFSAEQSSQALEQIKSRVLKLANCHAAVFVSRPAAWLGARWIHHYWPQLPEHTCFYAVGDSTAEILSGQGISAVVPGRDMTSEGLLALPDLQADKLQQLPHCNVLIFRGGSGREILAKTLRERGAEVDHVELYRRMSVDSHWRQIHAAIKDGLDAVAIHSGEQLQALLDLLTPELRQILGAVPLLVPGQRLERLAREAGFQRLVVADNARPQSMVSALDRWYISRHD